MYPSLSGGDCCSWKGALTFVTAVQATPTTTHVCFVSRLFSCGHETQDRLWALPLFRAPAGASFSPEAFRLVTAFLRRGDLLEGRDNICAQMQVRLGNHGTTSGIVGRSSCGGIFVMKGVCGSTPTHSGGASSSGISTETLGFTTCVVPRHHRVSARVYVGRSTKTRP